MAGPEPAARTCKPFGEAPPNRGHSRPIRGKAVALLNRALNGSRVGVAFAPGTVLPAEPQLGDVVMRQDHTDSGFCYTLGLFPGTAQISFRARETALAVAWGYAVQHQKTVWEDRNGALVPEPSPPVPSDGRLRRRMARAR